MAEHDTRRAGDSVGEHEGSEGSRETIEVTTPALVRKENAPAFSLEYKAEFVGEPITHFGGTPAIRVVRTPEGPIVELADGRDALGEIRWIRAVLTPDRRNTGEVVLEGWIQISDALGVSIVTARAWAKLADYRLPVRFGVRGPYIIKSLLRAWVTDRSYAATRPSRIAGVNHRRSQQKPRQVKTK